MVGLPIGKPVFFCAPNGTQCGGEILKREFPHTYYIIKEGG